ncbi:hypothetical protein LGH82_02030 [Mesorhizobium sp. PAMC28654]|uniref:hypothetical protein n=1 Tax=Mesorhizobium sp. PAMC28654 TaxID=2880934 RepID=UPI001D0B88A6|nr:hypothetical protein [Mesorhizobium sp. PAMC28654]UDL90199.1 hypothetical protein LGH82_02030 [Mesorhizobium sp. PAMC28654]
MVWDVLNARILEIWQEHIPPNEEGALAPLFYPDRGKSDLLFVGFNPSFSEKEAAKRALGIDVSEFYKWKGFQGERLPQMAEIQGRFMKDLYYFKPMQLVAQEVKMAWAHLDIYPVRKTNQKKTLSYLKGKTRLKDSLESLFETTIRRLQPEIIIVANAYASQCVKRLFDGHLPFDEKVGFHRLQIEGTCAAVFFSSMLSGQRALDTGSFERLRWHVRKAAETLKPTKEDRSRHMSWEAGNGGISLGRSGQGL